MSRSLRASFLPFVPRVGLDGHFAVPEAVRLTPSAESVHPSGVPTSGGAEPAGAAKQPHRGNDEQH